jgi:uncharacterized protein
MNSQSAGATTSAPDAYLVGSATSIFSISGLQIGLLPILATIGLALLVLVPSGYVFLVLREHTSMQGSMATPWLLLAHHAVQLAIALALIAWLSRRNFSAYGLKWPKHRHYVPSALLWGAVFGLLMTFIPPAEKLSLPPGSIGAWLFFEAIFVGPTEEIPFRGLLQTYLMQRSSGRVRFGRYDMHVAGVILAILFALAHLPSFWTENIRMAIGQQIYAFALGILYAYWREKSGSLLAPIVGHNVSDGVVYFLTLLMTWFWH